MSKIFTPDMPIYDAVLLVHDQHDDLMAYETDKRYTVHRDDLRKMASMGLDTLPVECIAIPEASPLLSGGRAQLNATVDYSRRLSEFFPVYFVAALYELQSLISRFDTQAFVIGGITRNLLMFHQKRLEVQDVDITVEGDAIALTQFLAENSRNFQILEQFPEFGTTKVQYKDSLIFDFASTRQEVYPSCGALPVVVKRGVLLADDIIRRDFTVNALAFSIHALGHVLDYSNGIRDIEKREIRVLHPVSFFEDPSRILRALKFCARFGFTLSAETRQLLEHFLRHGNTVYKGGGDRIKEELNSLLRAEESPVKKQWVTFFVESGCYRLLNMETTFTPGEETIERLEKLPHLLPILQSSLTQYTDKDFPFDVYLCFLCREMTDDEFQQTSKRLGLTRHRRENVEQFLKLKCSAQDRFGAIHEFSSPAEIYDIFHNVHFITLCACIAELGMTDERRMKTVLEAFLKYKRKWEKLELELDGNDLMDLGVPEGKLIGRMLDDLLHAKLAGQVPERLDEIQYIQHHLQQQQPQEEGENVSPPAP